MKIQNASQMPKVYYGLHFFPGVASYQEGDQEYRILVNTDTIRKMDASFSGKPVYVEHVDGVKPESVENADGFVFESFYNKLDGKHWVKFVAVTDKAHQAIAKGWKLSNAYFIKEKGVGGVWNGLEYNHEVMNGEYEHLAIVPNPRYAESIILTPEEFKAYNEQKESELKKLQNSKEIKKEIPSMFKFWKREKVENGLDIENTMIELPKTKKEFSIAQVINMADEAIEKEGKALNEEEVKHVIVKTANGEMKVEELVNKYNEMCQPKKENEEIEKKDIHVDIDSHKGEEKPENEEVKEEVKEEIKKENEEEKKEDEKKSNAFFDELKKANNAGTHISVKTLHTSYEAVAVGKQKYGK